MRICIHRGSKEIGGSCVEIESSGKRLIIDFGLPLDADENHIKYIPQIASLDGSDPDLLGILISHPHLDHFGLLSHISPKIPVGIGPAARQILKAAAPFLKDNWSIPLDGWSYESELPFKIGPFIVTPYLVDHSAYDAYALQIECDGKKLFYSGDFRAHGRKGSLFDRMIETPPKNIDTLLLEGSSIGRLKDDQQFKTEPQIETEFEEVLSSTKGLGLVHTSAQNIDRVVSIMRASKRTGRKFVIDLYSAAILEATDNPKIPQSYWEEVALYIPNRQRVQIKNNKWFPLLKKHSSNRMYIEDIQDKPENYTILFRPIHCTDLERGKCLDGSSYIYSQWEGYWDRGSYNNVKYWLKRNAISKISIHTSGHASPVDLKKFVTAVSPGKVVPIHSFEPNRYPDLFSNVEIHNDGEWWKV